MTRATILAFPPLPAPEPLASVRVRVPERREVVFHDSGHVWRQDRAHVEMVLRVKAGLCIGEGVRR